MPRSKFNFGSIVEEYTQKPHHVEGVDATQRATTALNDKIVESEDLVECLHNTDYDHSTYNAQQTPFHENPSNDQDDDVAQSADHEQLGKRKYVTRKAKTAKNGDNAHYTPDKHNTHLAVAAGTRRFTLVLSESHFENIKVIASLKQISITKAMLLAIEKYTNANKGVIEKYKSIFCDFD